MNLGSRYEPSRPWHDLVGRFQDFTLEGYNQNVRSPQFPDAPPGLLYRGDPGVPEDGTRPDMEQRVWTVRDCMGRDRRRQDQHPRRRRHVLRHAPGRRLQQRRRQRTPLEHPRRRHRAAGTVLGFVSRPHRLREAPSTTTKTKTTSSERRTRRSRGPVLVESFDEVFDTPLTYNYNLAFEREVATGWMARAAYVGSTATNGRSNITLNPAIYTPGGPTGNPDARRVMPDTAVSTIRPGSPQPVQLHAAHAEPALCGWVHGAGKLHVGRPAGNHWRTGKWLRHFDPDLENIIDTLRYGVWTTCGGIGSSHPGWTRFQDRRAAFWATWSAAGRSPASISGRAASR